MRLTTNQYKAGTVSYLDVVVVADRRPERTSEPQSTFKAAASPRPCCWSKRSAAAGAPRSCPLRMSWSAKTRLRRLRLRRPRAAANSDKWIPSPPGGGRGRGCNARVPPGRCPRFTPIPPFPPQEGEGAQQPGVEPGLLHRVRWENPAAAAPLRCDALPRPLHDRPWRYAAIPEPPRGRRPGDFAGSPRRPWTARCCGRWTAPVRCRRCSGCVRAPADRTARTRARAGPRDTRPAITHDQGQGFHAVLDRQLHVASVAHGVVQQVLEAAFEAVRLAENGPMGCPAHRNGVPSSSASPCKASASARTSTARSDSRSSRSAHVAQRGVDHVLHLDAGRARTSHGVSGCSSSSARRRRRVIGVFRSCDMAVEDAGASADVARQALLHRVESARCALDFPRPGLGQRRSVDVAAQVFRRLRQPMPTAA